MPTPITKKGYDALKAELDRLRKVERPKVIEAIAEARAHGDLSENAEYDAAKERQAFIESRISEIETKLADARVVEITGRNSDTVVFGATVMVIEQESQEKKRYTLVGQDEADLKFNKISVQSPVGRALIGKRVGDFVEVKAPTKTVEYEVVEITFEDV
ncbi:MAG: transcription elongation factor GreA [Nitrospira sp.]|nr:transcription elongation factor GreA [Nitrospira sp.]MCP9475384.1 transcription elongation factor GreA [Nitrospira sp.]